MKQFVKSLFSQPRTATLLLISSLFITALALVPAFYVILVLNKFLSFLLSNQYPIVFML